MVVAIRDHIRMELTTVLMMLLSERCRRKLDRDFRNDENAALYVATLPYLHSDGPYVKRLP
jgi:hypothetical protein